MIAFESLDATLRSLEMDQEAAEYHGILCGMLCYRDDAPEDLGLVETGRSIDVHGTGLRELRQASLEQLQKAHVEFVLMLPDDDEVLQQRVEALAQWCSGFLYGLATSDALDMTTLSEDAAEIVRDFTELSQAGFDTGAPSETDEQDYAELVEYVRVGAQLLFLECRQGQMQASPSPEQTH